MEHQLFEHLFPGLDPSASALSPLVDTLADILYDALRPAYIHLQDISALCQLVDILQREVRGTHYKKRPCPPLFLATAEFLRSCSSSTAAVFRGLEVHT